MVALYAAAIEGDNAIPEGFVLKPLRGFLTCLDEGLIWAVGRANHLIHCEQTHNYCGSCSPRIKDKTDEQASIPFYSVLAGFVEPSETLENCDRREVREEVGITVGGISYFGSQPWPFSNSLMIGFTAE